MAIIIDSDLVEGREQFYDRIVSNAADPDDDTVEIVANLNIGATHCFVGVQMFDGSGNRVVASAGTFLVKIKTINTQQFEVISGGGTITGSAPTTLSWAGNTVAVQVVPTGIVGVVTWKVFVTQNRT